MTDGVPSLDVLSLGSGGEIVLGFASKSSSTVPGPDLIVFENPFWPGGQRRQSLRRAGRGFGQRRRREMANVCVPIVRATARVTSRAAPASRRRSPTIP